MDLIRIIKSEDINKKDITKLIPRTQSQLEGIKEDVENIIKNVKNNGNDALLEYTEKFDGVKLQESNIKVSQSEIADAYDQIDSALLEALREAKRNLINFHEAQKSKLIDWDDDFGEGITAGQIFRPIESVGIYVPGGRAIYPSTVLMAATPAQVAGVKNLVLCSPPQKDGRIAPAILVAAREFGIDEIYKVGGAQAIAAMAYGTESIPAVQKIIGPGNKWVNAAKQLLTNMVSIDTPAGPSEICIIADDTANPSHVIIDLISQVEHDPDNIGIVLTTSSELIETIARDLEIQVNDSKRKDIIKQALENNSLIIKTKSLEESFEISNIFAPEHLELIINDPRKYLDLIENAGAVFIGPNTPVPLGDYSAGTNHILPTGGNAKKYSGLNVLSFLKVIDVLECNFKGLESLSKSSMKIAEFEGLHAHKQSIKERLKDKK